MPQQWTVEQTDAAGLIDRGQYEHYRDAKDVADQWWDEYKDQPGHTVMVYCQSNRVIVTFGEVCRVTRCTRVRGSRGKIMARFVLFGSFHVHMSFDNNLGPVSHNHH
jgi:hypothetical protein